MRSVLILLLTSMCPPAFAACGAYLTRPEILRVDSRIAREIRRLTDDPLYVRLNWSETIPATEVAHAMDITKMLQEEGTTPATHPAIPLVPPPPSGRGLLLRALVRTPGRRVPAIINAILGNADGAYQLRVTVRPTRRSGAEANRARAEEAIAVFTLLAAAPYVSRLSFRMDLNVIEDEKFVIELQKELRQNARASEVLLPLMDAAADVVLANPEFVIEDKFHLRGFREGAEVGLENAHDFHALYELRLDEEVVEPLTANGRSLN